MEDRHRLGAVQGAALYVGALIGPGLLLVPALAVQAAGAASIVAWAGLLALSAPLAAVFGALGVRHPVAGGVSAYVREGLGERAAAVTGLSFVAAIVLGGPAVALIGGYYVAALTGSGAAVAAAVGLAIYATVIGANVFGLRVSARFQLGLAAVLVVVLALAVGVALPSHGGDNWAPFAPHGWWAVGTAANILVWLFVGWEAGAQLAGDFRRPERDLPRAMGLAFVLVTVLYVALAVATIGVTAGTRSKVPLADLVAVGFGRAGRDATAVLAVALTMGTMNVYLSGGAKLIAALAQAGSLPRRLAADAARSVPRVPLYAVSATAVPLFAWLIGGAGSTDELIRATSACFIAVYALALASATRILAGRMRAAAGCSLALVCVLAVFSGWYLLVPVAAALAALALHGMLVRELRRARDAASDALG
ncbi:MAG TPA: amino acid permease [Gaiellaceae bacterium]|nr:amino acid permease [Gaiellaceae bacterium]